MIFLADFRTCQAFRIITYSQHQLVSHQPLRYQVEGHSFCHFLYHHTGFLESVRLLEYYSFAEIEFYYHKKGVLNRDVDNCVYPRTCEAGKFLWHDTGVDICFKSECDIENYYFGGILIRSLIDKESKQIIGGPVRCANELAFLCKAGKTPHLRPKKEIDDTIILYHTIRQGIDCDVDKDGKAKVNYCYFIKMKDRNWNRNKNILKMKSDYSGYMEEIVTYRYSDNPESNRIEKLMKKRKDKEKIGKKDYCDK